MKQFSYILFGGLLAIICGVGVAYGGARVWDAVTAHADDAGSVAAVSDAEISSSDGTSVSGLTRSIRYTADQEEDLIDSATAALPAGSDSRITAKAYLVKDLTTGAIAAEYKQDTLMPIASLSKLAAAVVEQKLIPPDARIPITAAVMRTYGNTADFRAGETFTASDLLYPLLMVSSNDAAEAYAQYYGRAEFIKAMNDFVQSIGAYRTYFADPSGLDPENVSTADDQAIIMDWIRKNDPDLVSIMALHAKTIRDHTWVNPTHFLSWSYYLGGKNGYLPEADRTASALFALGPAKDVYSVVVLGSDNRDADMIKLLAKVK
jgi:D-alanyl-D-alanine carboxypeptidase